MNKYQSQINAILPNWIRTESGGNPKARSSAGAMGLLQLMPGTAQDLGVNDPYDPVANVAAGKQYLGGLLDHYGGDMRTALMAYHAGQSNVDNYLAGKKSGVGPLTKAYPDKILGKQKPIQVADSGQIAADAQYTDAEALPMPPKQPYDIKGLLDSINVDYQAPEAQQPKFDISPGQAGLLSMGLNMLMNSRGHSLGESLGQGGLAGLNAMQQTGDYQSQIQQEAAQAQQEAEAQARERAQQAALGQLDLSGIPKEAMPSVLLKLGLTKDALKMYADAGKRPEGVPTGFNVNEDGSLSPMKIGGTDYMQYQNDLATGKAQAIANNVSPVQQHTMANQDASLDLQRQKFAADQAEADRKAKEGVKPKDIPPHHKMVYVQNNDALRKIDSAIEAIDANPDALGMSNYLGDTIRQRSDPKGVGVRAAIADVGGVKLHDLSGAAISPSESKRLMPFIPQTTDSPEAAKAKLLNLRKEYESINEQIGQMYQEGYSRLPKYSSGGASGSWEAGKPPSADDLVNHYLGK